MLAWQSNGEYRGGGSGKERHYVTLYVRHVSSSLNEVHSGRTFTPCTHDGTTHCYYCIYYNIMSRVLECSTSSASEVRGSRARVRTTQAKPAGTVQAASLSPTPTFSLSVFFQSPFRTVFYTSKKYIIIWQFANGFSRPSPTQCAVVVESEEYISSLHFSNDRWSRGLLLGNTPGLISRPHDAFSKLRLYTVHSAISIVWVFAFHTVPACLASRPRRVLVYSVTVARDLFWSTTPRIRLLLSP